MGPPASASVDPPRLDALGETIRDRRRQLQLTQTGLAERSGWTQERISAMEHGKYGLPSLSGMSRLAAALHMPLLTLIVAAGFPNDRLGLDYPEDGQPLNTSSLLLTVHHLMSIGATDLREALDRAATVLATVMGADKIDAFLLELSTATLVALGASATPMAATQRRLGLDRMPLANQTREAEVYRSGRSYVSGHIDRDPQIARGVVEGMGAHSMLIVPLDIGGERRGVLAAFSAQSDRFTTDDVSFLEIAARWVGMMAHRAELSKAIATMAAESARNAAAGEIVTVVAHDLNNLLKLLTGRLDLLQRKLLGTERAGELEDVVAASRTTLRIEELVHGLLDGSRGAHG